jgi:hypothetical protein
LFGFSCVQCCCGIVGRLSDFELSNSSFSTCPSLISRVPANAHGRKKLGCLFLKSSKGLQHRQFIAANSSSENFGFEILIVEIFAAAVGGSAVVNAVSIKKASACIQDAFSRV